MTAALTFDRFYRYDDLTDILSAFSEARPDLVRVEEIGRSHERRPIPVVVVTRFDTGPDDEKPAFWVDGNIHASEVSTSTMCLYHIDSLLRGYGDDDRITSCLDTKAFYICTRVNPDGAEWALADHPKIIRASTPPIHSTRSP